MNKSDIERRTQVLQIEHLPPLSVTATQLLEKVADSEAEIEELAAIIGRDPGLSARILGLANAAYFGQIRAVTTIKEAIVRVLGLNMVKSLSLSIVMSGSFDTKQCPGFELGAYWREALGCAELGKMIAMKLSPEMGQDSNMVYLCGLLHNLGALILAHAFPVECSKVYGVLAQDPTRDIHELEREFIGVTGQEAVEWLGIRWHMPQAVVRAVAHHADPGYEGPDEMTIAIVGGVATWLKAESRTPLTEVAVFKQRLQLMPSVLTAIDEKFERQHEELKSLANMLS